MCVFNLVTFVLLSSLHSEVSSPASHPECVQGLAMQRNLVVHGELPTELRGVCKRYFVAYSVCMYVCVCVCTCVLVCISLLLAVCLFVCFPISYWVWIRMCFFFSSLVSRPSTKGKEKQDKTVKKKKMQFLWLHWTSKGKMSSIAEGVSHQRRGRTGARSKGPLCA